MRRIVSKYADMMLSTGSVCRSRTCVLPRPSVFISSDATLVA